MGLEWKVEEKEIGSEGHRRSSKMLHWSRDQIFRKSPKQREQGPYRVSTGLAFGGHQKVTKRPQKFPTEEEERG